MSKSFKVKLSDSPSHVLNQARTAAEQFGVSFNGDETAGRFSGHGVEGHYEIADDILSLSITKKPFVMPWGLIESKFRSFFV